MKTVQERLTALGELYEKRNKLYGNNYMEFGAILSAMFPFGLELETEEEFNRFSIFVQAFAKFTRYAKAIKSGGHADSLDDISVYCQMMREYDELAEKLRPVHVNWGYKSQRELELGDVNEMRGG
jgi:hypothetical protein